MKSKFTALVFGLSLIMLTTSCGGGHEAVDLDLFASSEQSECLPKGCEDGHEAVDLGLSVKWATCNVGATTPSENGNYYSWGELETKQNYILWGEYRFGEYKKFTKYCHDSFYGTVDNKETLEPDDDVANVNWGGNWRMPTQNEIQELIDKCTWEWMDNDGQTGYTVTGPNGNSIFLPVVGCKDERENDSYAGNYWSSSLSLKDSPVYAYELHFNKFGIDCRENQRIYGLTVRPVRP